MKYTILEKLTALREKLSVHKAGTRLLALLLTLVLLQGDLMLPAYSAGGEGESGETSAQTSTPKTTVPTTPEQTEVELKLPVDEDTLVITLDGAETTAVSLLPYEKTELKAEGLEQQADYQWQIQIPETDTWVNIQGQTEQSLKLTYAMLGNLLDANNSAYVRCVASVDGEIVARTATLKATVTESAAAVQKTTAAESDISTEAIVSASTMFALPRSTDSDSTEDDIAVIDEDIQIVSVTIEYYYQNRLGEKGNMVMDPYVARVKQGDPLEVAVACKVFPGYETLLIGNPDGLSLNDKNELIIDLDNVSEDRTYEVHYKEIMVKYYARFFLQNVYNDLYTERTNVLTDDQIEQMKGYAGDQPDDNLIHPQITGFSALFHQPDKIAADGSTVFEVYYDRNYCLINFDLDGGFGTAPVYARYESSFTVATPTRPGYTFAGWELVSGTVPADAEKDANGLVKKIPASNVTYKAKWTMQQTTYAVVYWRENAEDNQYTYWGVDERTILSGSTVNGTDDVPELVHKGEADYFTFNPVLSDKNVLVEGDGTTVVNVYYTRNYYTITFKAPGICTIPENHTHTDACYDYICLNGNHTHTADCLICEVAVHVHNATCCTLGNHTHDADCCVLEEHTTHNSDCCELTVHDDNDHEVSCWDDVEDPYDGTPRDAPTNPKNGQVYQRSNRSTKYIYIEDSWYTYSGSESSGTVVTPSCHKHGDGNCTCPDTHTHGDGNCTCSEHVHGDGNCICEIPAHQHSSTCYDCGEAEHTHTEDCKRLICGIPTGHTHSTTCTNSSRTNTVKIVRRKYQQSLDDIWHHTDANGETQFGLQDDNGVAYDDGQRWDPSDTDFYNEVLVYISTMPPDDFTLTLSTSTNSTKTMYYYLQVLPGEAYDVEKDGKYYKLDDTIKAKYGYITKAEDFFDIKGYVQYTSDPTFNNNGQINNASTVYFYYDRITDHYLQFKNNGILLDDEQIYGIMYGASLADQYFQPDYPSNLEPNAYYFDQWYTSEGYYEGTEVNWNTLTMPEGNLLLHAKWNPLTYAAYFYMDYDRYQSKTYFQSVLDTDHGEPMVTSNITLTPTHDVDPTYQFVGWFYINDEGKKIAFNPAEMAVRQELHLYAEWSSKTVKTYTVSYKLGKWDEATHTVTPIKEGEEGYRVLSADTAGYAFEASTRTFTAKSEDQLENLSQAEWEGSIWVPHTNSHSILIKADNSQNVFTFWYVPRTNIPYTVRYLDAATGQPVVVNDEAMEDKTVDPNSNAVVTEQFVYVPGYIPDAFYKTLVLSANEAENVITFYYTKDTGDDNDDDGEPDNPSSRYLVVHYIQNIGSDTYSVYTTDDLIGAIGSEARAEALTIPGFTFDHAMPNSTEIDGKNFAYGTVTSGEDAETALKLELYYTRNTYSYTVEYLDADTLAPIRDTKVTEKVHHFDDVVEETAPQDITGYDLYGSETQTLKISAIETLNKITFLYTQKPLIVNYVPVCTDPKATGFGYVFATSEYKDIKGTTAIANPGFRFLGWYAEETCENRLTTEAFYQPVVSTAGGIYEYTFYALFEPITLTIKQAGMKNETDSGIYQIVNNSTNAVVTTVAITGNNSAIIEPIPSGIYTIREITGNWTWTYENTTNQTCPVTADVANTVTFNFASKTVDWLHGECYAANNFN